MKEKRIVGSALIKIKVDKSKALKFFSPIERTDPKKKNEGG
jgi:hypothetical protein